MGTMVRNVRTAKVHRSGCATLDTANPRSWEPYTWDGDAPPSPSRRCGTCQPGPGEPGPGSGQGNPDAESATEVFYAEELDICASCQTPIEPRQPVAYTLDEQIVHSQHHDDPTVRAAGAALGDKPLHRPSTPATADRHSKGKSKNRRGKRR